MQYPFAISLFSSFANVGSDDNCTTNIPGFTHHGNCKLLCKTPADWKHVLSFFAGNYLAHAATVITEPGQSVLMAVLIIVLALLFPTSGLHTALLSITSRAIFAPTALQTAARAGALCMVIKDVPSDDDDEDDANEIAPSFTPRVDYMAPPNAQRNEQIRAMYNATAADGTVTQSSPLLVRTTRWEKRKEVNCLLQTKVQGICVLPAGYSLMQLPADAKFDDDDYDAPSLLQRCHMLKRKLFGPEDQSAPRPPVLRLACKYSLVKILVSIYQLLFSIATLYKSRGDQITRYGFFAPGLTVAPYAWMSLINLLGNLFRPEYPAMYSNSLTRLRAKLRADGKQDEFKVAGTIGHISAESERRVLGIVAKDGKLATGRGDNVAFLIAPLIVGSIPVLIVGILSNFSVGKSTKDQQLWIAVWIYYGILIGTGIGHMYRVMESKPILQTQWEKTVEAFFSFLTFLIFVACAIGGFVTIGRMVREYGTCVELL